MREMTVMRSFPWGMSGDAYAPLAQQRICRSENQAATVCRARTDSSESLVLFFRWSVA